MELVFPTLMTSGIFTEPEVRWKYVCIAQEVELMGPTVVRYLIQQMFSRPYTLECTQQTVVSDNNCLYTVVLFNYSRIAVLMFLQ